MSYGWKKPAQEDVLSALDGDTSDKGYSPQSNINLMGKKKGLGGGNGGSGGGNGGGKRNWLGLRSGLGLGLGLGGKSSSSLGALKRRMSFQVGTMPLLQTIVTTPL